MEHEKIIRDVKELLKFPHIGKSLYHKIEELKGILAENLEKYMPLMEKHTQSQRKTHQLQDGIRFQLKRLSGELWVPCLPEKYNCSPYEVIPQPLIDYIVDHRKKTDVIEMKPGVSLADIPGKIFDLVFEKSSSDSIWGIVQTRQDKDSEVIYPNRQAIKNQFQGVGEDSEKKEVITLLLYYLLNNPYYYEHITAEFFYHWKPLLDNQLLRANAM